MPIRSPGRRASASITASRTSWRALPPPSPHDMDMFEWDYLLGRVPATDAGRRGAVGQHALDRARTGATALLDVAHLGQFAQVEGGILGLGVDDELAQRRGERGPAPGRLLDGRGQV